MDIPYKDRLKSFLDFWFDPNWNRDTPRPTSLTPIWWGYKYAGEKCFPLTEEEQKTVDDLIRKEFEEDLKNAQEGLYEKWKTNHEGILALTILFDQIPRNIYRKTGKAFEFESYALSLIRFILSERLDRTYKFFERVFLYLPLQHSENMEDQILCHDLFSELYKQYENDEEMKVHGKKFMGYAEDHKNIISEYGRYPHRNFVLGRIWTEKEKIYLENGGRRFGQ